MPQLIDLPWPRTARLHYLAHKFDCGVCRKANTTTEFLAVLFAHSFGLKPFSVVRGWGGLPVGRRAGPLRRHPRSRSRLRSRPVLHLRTTLLRPILHLRTILHLRSTLRLRPVLAIPVLVRTVVFLRTIVVSIIPSVIPVGSTLRRRRKRTKTLVGPIIPGIRVSAIPRVHPRLFRRH